MFSASKCSDDGCKSTGLRHCCFQLVCVEASSAERYEDRTPMVWIGGSAPQGGSSAKMSHGRHRYHPTRRRGPGSRSLLRFASHDESTRGPSCKDLHILFHLRRLRSIRRSLGRDVTARLVSALVISRLDYCNSVLTHFTSVNVGTAPESPQRRCSDWFMIWDHVIM